MNIVQFREKVNTICDELLASKQLNPAVESIQVNLFCQVSGEQILLPIKGVEYFRSASTGEWEVVIAGGTD